MKYNITNTNVRITSNFYIFLNIWNYAPFLYFCMQLYKLFCSRALDKFYIACHTHISKGIEGRRIRAE